MCRWLAYTGSSIPLETLLFNAHHSLIDQSMSSRSTETPTNGDGFGVGWYGKRGQPGLFRSVRPAWNDFNLRELAAHIESPLFLAHVRAASLGAVQETNCHPFRYGPWLFMHNGEIEGVDQFRRDLVLAVAPQLFNCIQGTTDSEIMFYLALTFGLECDPLGALARMAGFVEKAGHNCGIAQCLWMTLGVSDGKRIYVVRYASDGDAPTLYHSRDSEDLHRLDPGLRGRISLETRVIVSEPLGDTADDWVQIPENTAMIVQKGEAQYRPFHPESVAC
jgi:glutamine amidotransferase